MLKALLIMCLAGVTLAQYRHHGEHHREPSKDHYAKTKHDVEHKHAEEEKEEEKPRKGHSVRGYFSYHEKDGTKRVYHYDLDHKKGYSDRLEGKTKDTKPEVMGSQQVFLKHHYDHQGGHHHDSPN